MLTIVKNPTMNPQLISYMALVGKYHPLLFRFARFTVRDEKVAKSIAGRALATLWANRKGIYTMSDARQFLKTTTRVLCHAWLHEQALLLARQSTKPKTNE
jgi:DNA-directed RNA polymerase specialized sigma24 family protein